MKTRGFVSLSLAAIFVCAAFLPALSQEQKKQAEDVIKITAQLVQVDVVVTDKNNKPVAGLKREDFELQDNDKPQVISFFSYEESKLRPVEADADATRELPRVITPGELKRVIAFVVDTLHMSSESLYRTRKMLRDFIDTKMEPGDLVLIYSTGGGSGLYQQFTADQRALRQAVNHLRQAFILDSDGPSRRGSTTDQAALSLLPKLSQYDPGGGGAAQSNRGINTGDAIEDGDVRSTLSAIDGTIKAMSKFPGRKIGVFISEGMRTFRTNTTTELTETTYRAARANVVFYSIDPAGLEPQSFASSDGQGLKTQKEPDATSPTGFREETLIDRTQNNSLGDKRDNYFESQEALQRLANETGGKFYNNSNDIKRGLTGLLEENSAYYLLGFQPEGAKWDGKFHKLKVTVRDRPDLTVSTRKGYIAKIEKEKPATREIADPKAAEFVEAFTSPLVRRDIDLQLTPFYMDDAKREPFLTSLLHINTSRVGFKQVDGLYKARLTVTGVLVSANGKIADSFSNTYDLNYSPKDYEGIRRDGLRVTRGTGVKPGVYQMRVLVREADTGLIGTAISFVEVPDIKANQLSLSSIYTDAQLLQPAKSADTVSSASSLSQRRFKRNSQFAYVLFIYNAKSEGGKYQLEISSRVLRNGQVVFASQPKPVEVLEGSTPPSRILTGNALELSGLTPDDYTLEVTVTDKLRKKGTGSVLRQEIDFIVE
ncbi:MAG TPA: VWA domain-containing protein [Blastocatellia bacterium]|nr:VWA domain-containing protein [Blastocatellia bacterium]